MTPMPAFGEGGGCGGGGGGSLSLSLALSLPLSRMEDEQRGRGPGQGGCGSLPLLDFEETGEHRPESLVGVSLRASSSSSPSPAASPFLVLSVPPPRGSPEEADSPGDSSDEDRLPTPERVIFPASDVRLGYRPEWRIGSGMINVGNTCYLNSTLQALFHIPAFVNWLVSDKNHIENCTQNGGCIICSMRKTLQESQQNTGDTIKPWQIYSKLRLICRHLTPGNQEDAHEFLRYLIESIEKTYLLPYGSMDQYSKETTPINQIFGGYLRSSVRCLSCGRFNTTFQHFQDLLIDIKKVDSLEEGLDLFFSKEKLEDCSYKCESCNRKVSATKQFTIERAPMVICIVMKRFNITGGKISKHVPFKSRISMKKYMFDQNNQSSNLNYNLVSALTHVGISQNCGHYTAIGQGPENKFYQFDDSCVRLFPVSSVLGTNAYILFYELEASNSIKPRFIGPVLPDSMKLKNESEPKMLSLKMNCSIVKTNSMGNSKPYNPVILNRKDSQLESQPSKISNSQHFKSSNEDDTPSLSSNKMNGDSPANKNNQADKPLPSTSSYLVWKKSKSDSDSDSDNVNTTNGNATLNGESKSNSYKSATSNGENLQNGNKHKKKQNDSKTVVNELSKNKPYFVPSDSKSENHDSDENNKSAKHTNNGTDRTNSDAKSSNESTEEKDVASALKRFSYRGYGSQVNTWNGTHSQLNRQVFEDRKSLKRPSEDDDLDRGRMKRVKYSCNEFYYSKNNHNNYNPFDEQQNQRTKWNNSNHSKKTRRHYYYYYSKGPYHNHRRHYNRNR